MRIAMYVRKVIDQHCKVIKKFSVILTLFVNSPELTIIFNYP